MEILGWMLIGLIVGMVARFIFPPRVGSGPILFILLGIAGAMLGGFLWQALAPSDLGRSAFSYAVAAVSALAMILLYRGLLRYRR